ncbi:MAG TPA: flagellar hook-basal body complex protein FliE [Verrucomicrobiae bacterium]|jgi:flagellar hook-basal body complex protein FliE|nr:flagellar hook-basal body complex protein FliE [Verrucomicrobiae bacterium]
MDALSALKMVVGSQTGGVQDAAAANATQAIPAVELQQVTSDSPVQSTTATGAGFENFLGGLINDVAQKQAAASDAVSGLMSGKNVSLHQAMISMEEANVSFQMMVEVRNKLLDSYQELMRMQV